LKLSLSPTATVLAALFATIVINNSVAAIRSEPQPTPMPEPIEAPRDVAFPGVMTIAVDATDLDRRILNIKQTIPVTPGHVVLLYPRWIPGVHAPVGPVYSYAGLKITANGKTLPWVRDSADVYAYHVDVPIGVSLLNIDAQLLTATESAHGGITMTREMVRLNWYTVALYPAGYFTRRIDVTASLKLPSGWQLGTALENAAPPTAENVFAFKTVSMETLADSPVFAGKYFRKFELDTSGKSRVTLNAVADEPELLEAKPAAVETLRELVRQADKLYGARHFDHYDFLLSISDRLGGSGVEHQRSSENGVAPRYFTAWDTAFISRDLLAHEYTHSWNGKYRRPADLWTPSFNVPMRDSLLWVYEGQTQYWGHVLATRAGFLNKAQALDELATMVANYDSQAGRSWRNLQDTTNDPIIASRRAIPWRSWQRSEDYYREGSLLWLEIDTLIRQRSKNKRSLDDFARAFFGVNDGDWGQLTYTFDDIAATLNSIEPYDWKPFLRSRLDDNATNTPMEGIKRGGYQLLFSETQSDYAKASETRRKVIDLTYSLGVVLDSKGKFTAVQWDGPIFKSGLTTGSELIAVNGTAFDADKLKAAVKATKSGAALELLIKQGETYRTFNIDYRNGLRYPKLERVKDAPALLDDILAAKK
jgi:predicted metalloprotease with PDZ domain